MKNACKQILPLFLVVLLLSGCLAKTISRDEPVRGVAPVESAIGERSVTIPIDDGEAQTEGIGPGAGEEIGKPLDEELLEGQPVSDDLTPDFTRQDWERINTFLSSFSEVYFTEYDVFGGAMDPEDALYDEYELVNFAYMHLKLHDPSKIASDGENYVVSRADLDNCLNGFFGRTVSAGTKSRTYAGQYEDVTETAAYQNDAYYFLAADGGMFNQFSVVNYAAQTADGTWYVEFNVYALDFDAYFENGLTADDYRMTASEALLDERLTYVYSGAAELANARDSADPSYQLLKYRIYYSFDHPEQPEATAGTEPAFQFVSDDLTVNFSREDWTRINTFLSNFSEVFFTEYDVFSEGMDPADALRDEYEMILFGYLHLKINDVSKLSSDGYSYIITRSDMDTCLTRFFGHTVTAGTKSRTYAGQYGDFTETAEYKNSAYYFPAADGEAYNQFTVVNRVVKTDRDTYYVEFNVYSLDYETYFDSGLGASYYRMTASEALRNEHLTYEYSGWAEVRDYQKGTYRSYQLVDYSISRS